MSYYTPDTGLELGSYYVAGYVPSTGRNSLQLDNARSQQLGSENYADEVEQYLAYEEEQEELVRISQGLPEPVIGVQRRKSRFLRLDTVKDYTKVGKKRGGTSVTTMTSEAKEKLVTEVMEGEMDNLMLLQKLHTKFKNIGLEFPAVEVRFKNLTVSAEVSVGSRSVPTIWNSLLSLGETVAKPIFKILRTRQSVMKTVVMLDDISGVFRPGRVTLLLGPPGAGKSTLLKVLSGQMKDKDVKVTGEVSYNGVPMKDKSFVVERTGAYIDQVDSHIAEMTVRETMAFGARMMGRGSGNGHDPLLEHVFAKEKEMGITPDPQLEGLLKQLLHGSKGDNIVVDIMSNLLGLGVCIDTLVGNDLLKGISGGQKKRVTTGEMAVGRLPVMMMDAISTGLDSASTFLISKSLRNLSHLLRTNIVVALLQPSPETYDIFDDIILMGEGKILYHGPKEGVEAFTSSLGLMRPPRKAMADFLQEITSKVEQQAYLRDHSKDYMSCTDISKAFQASIEGQARGGEVATPAKPTELDMMKMMKHPYALGSCSILKHLFLRELLLLFRQKMFIIIRAVQTIILAFAVGTMFVNQGKHTLADANYFMSVCFYSSLNMLVGGFAETPIFVMRLPVYYKQRNYHFYNAWSYCLSGALVRLPDNVLMVTLWSLMVYWCVGFTATAGQFFIFWFVLVSMYTFSTSIFRTIASLTRHQVVAQAVGAALLVLCINTNGFTLNRGSIPDWWIWAYWLNPMSYAIRALLVNEMNSDEWSTLVQPAGSEFNISLGIYALQNRSFQTDTWWVWVGVGVLLGASFLMVLLQAYFLHALDGLKGNAAISEEVEEKPNAVAGDEEEGGKGSKITSLPFTPFTLAFREIKYHVSKPAGKAGEELTLLKGIDGCFSPGVLTALMGASGAGKTTLMDVLAGRKTGGRMEGTVMLNGHPKVQSTFARVMGYVEQFDIHCRQATVLEALLFSGRMRLSGDLGVETTTQFVNEVMDLVEMRPLANALIGEPGVSGLSVEQRKRLTIAVELVANPSVVFMDEPTSGLDARAAAIVMRTVRNTVNTGRTVVCTIHQPSLDIFQSFDDLLLLKRGGEIIFFGSMGVDQINLIDHFESVPGVEKFKIGYNPANWMLEVTSPGAELDLGVEFATSYKTSKAAEKCKAQLDEVCSPVEGSTPLHFDTQFTIGTFKQFYLILARNLTSYWRSPNYNFVRIVITIFTGLVFGSLYWDIGMKRDSSGAVLNIMGCLFGSTTFLGIANVVIVLPVIHSERVVFYREKASGMFCPLAFALAQGMVELPYLVLQATMYVPIVYWMVGFEANVAKFFWFWLFNLEYLVTMTFFGIMAINLTSAPQFGTVFASFFFTLWNLTCGFLLPQPDIHPWWIWMYWGQPSSYTLYGLCASQLGDVHDTYINAAGPGETAEIVTVAGFIDTTYGFRHNFIGWCAFILLAFILCFHCVAIIALHKFNFQKR